MSVNTGERAAAFRAALTAASDQWQSTGRAAAGIVSRSYCLRTITPLLGGGVEAGQFHRKHPIRGKSIKGRLRFWWRLLAEAGVLDAQRGEKWIGTKLDDEERARFGGLDNLGKVKPSRVRVRVQHVSAASAGAWAQVPAYVCGLLGKPAERPEPAGQGLSFTVTLEVLPGAGPDTARLLDEVEAAMRWWANFGGVGARTRRGMGHLLPADEDTAFRLKPVSAQDAEKAGCDLLLRSAPSFQTPLAAWHHVISAYRHFRQGHDASLVAGVIAGIRLPSNPPVPCRSEILAALPSSYWRNTGAHGVGFDEVVRPLNKWKQHVDRAGMPHDGWEYKPGRSQWPEPDTIRGLICAFPEAGVLLGWYPTDGTAGLSRGWFPRSAFGLPIVGERLVPAHLGVNRLNFGKFRLDCSDGDNMASPLMIGVRSNANRQWEAYALLLPMRFRNEALTVEVDVRWTPPGHAMKLVGSRPAWPAVGIQATTLAAQVPPISNLPGPQPVDPLSAFMKFFELCRAP